MTSKTLEGQKKLEGLAVKIQPCRSRVELKKQKTG
jgi:hypothetical protein